MFVCNVTPTKTDSTTSRRAWIYQREVIRNRKSNKDRQHKGVIRNRKSNKDRQHNDQMKRNKRTNKDLQNTTQKFKDRATRIPPKLWDELKCSEGVAIPAPHLLHPSCYSSYKHGNKYLRQVEHIRSHLRQWHRCIIHVQRNVFEPTSHIGKLTITRSHPSKKTEH